LPKLDKNIGLIKLLGQRPEPLAEKSVTGSLLFGREAKQKCFLDFPKNKLDHTSYCIMMILLITI